MTLLIQLEKVYKFILKKDGTKVYASCIVENGKVKADFTNQMLVAPGKSQAELECVYGTERITTTIFIIDVLPTNIDNDAIESSNEYSALTTLIAQAIADGVVEGGV